MISNTYKIFAILKILCILLCYSSTVDSHNRVKRIVGGEQVNQPPEDDPIVYVRFARRSAYVRGMKDFPNYVFKGIRFAESPTGRDRFVRPKQHFLSGEVNATEFPPPCVQPVPGTNQIIGKEDCLFLNVFTPQLPYGNEGWPVVVWIHGGGFRYGSASQYGVRHLVGKQIVVVTIQYRLGSLGFLSSGDPQLPGNVGLWDMALAVQWVRNHIGFFGGNPHKIVVMGHGTGASSALFLALSNIAKGLTSAVVAMSGSSISHWAVDNTPGITFKEVADYQGCPTTAVIPMTRCLQNLAASNLIKGDSAMEMQRLNKQGFVSGLNGVLSPTPTSEGRFTGRSLPPIVENHPLDDMSSGDIPKIPLLTGITKDETKKACQGQYRQEIESKLLSIPNFLDKLLIQNLQSFTGIDRLVGNGSAAWNLLDPLQFINYVKITKNNLEEGINKIADLTSDALFNLPAFLTAKLWTKTGSEAYLYRFEHNGKARKGRFFLKGLPLVGNDNTDNLNDTVSHGDDLAYLFDARNLDGTPLPDEEEMTEDDVKVREIYTQMIADFVRNSKVKINENEVTPFSSTNSFVQISAKPKQSFNFKFCEMGLWAGLAERLKSNTCQLYQVLESQLKGVQTTLFDTAGSALPIDGIGERVSNVDSGLTGGIGKLSQVNLMPSKKASVPSFPFGLG